MAKKKKIQDGVKVRGMFRVQIVEDPSGNPTIVGDSGWRENTVVNLGFNEFLVKNLGTSLTGVKISHAALGTGTAPAVADTTLQGELAEANGRIGVTAATSSGSKTLRNTATFASGVQFTSAVTRAISNIGLFNTSTQGAASIFAGNTYASSQLASNNNVNITYDIIFA